MGIFYGVRQANSSNHAFRKGKEKMSFYKIVKPYFDQRRFSKKFKNGFHIKWFAKPRFQRFENNHFQKRSFNYICYTCSKYGHIARNCNQNFWNKHQGPNSVWIPKRS